MILRINNLSLDLDVGLDESKGAVFSGCRMYRYLLTRRWDGCRATLNVIGLNPSTADERVDDQTIRTCTRFARKWGYGALAMTNLFAFRATEPKDMKAHSLPIGDENDAYLMHTAMDSGLVLAAWGVDGAYLNRQAQIMAMLKNRSLKVYCLKTTKDGFPHHPLYLPGDTEPEEFYGL